MTLRVAIVGRPNVGKSTLFNRLVRKKLAIVDDRPGVTRDWREAPGTLLDLPLIVIDTAGLEESFDDSIPARMRQQTDAALRTADVVLFVTDARDGITPMDRHFATWLRAQGKPIIHAINKCEDENAAIAAEGEAYVLGLGDPITLSAAHGFGIEDLYHRLAAIAEPPAAVGPVEDEHGPTIDWRVLDKIEGDETFDFAASIKDIDAPDKPIKVAIVGRPNVGKSTLLNTILGEHRVMTGPEAGITRDSVAVAWHHKGRHFRLVDTAGMRRRPKIQERLEKLSVDESLRAIRLAHVCLLLIDATEGLEKQDLTIARHITDEGRALVIVINKWDAVTDKSAIRAGLEEKIRHTVAQVPGVPILYISALSGKKIEPLLDTVASLFDVWGRRVPTSPLNRWVQARYDRNPPPLVGGRPNRLRYMTQIKNRPPTFALWCGHPDHVPDHYQRYLLNALRDDFNLPGIPIRLFLRTSKNPYAG